jgi:photosynthetic reaction center cytochrome c subunit
MFRSKKHAALPAMLFISILLCVGSDASPQIRSNLRPSELEGKTAEQVYKNIQALKGTPASELVPSMHVIKAALGVECEFCHTSDRASDAMPSKEISRQMIKMMFAINQSSFAGTQQVTCFTCHQGNPIPMTIPPHLPAPMAAKTVGSSVSQLPTVEEILNKYIQALGGEEAIKKISSRVITATENVGLSPDTKTPLVSAVTFYSKAPNLELTVYDTQGTDATLAIYHTPPGTSLDGFDGKTAWVQDQKGAVDKQLALDETRVARNASFYECLNLKSEYESMAVTGTEQIGGQNAYVVVGHPANDFPEKLDFDVQTGLLLRKSGVMPTPLGNSPFEILYDDYRDAGDGVKIPFLIQSFPATPRQNPTSYSIIHVTEVHDNVSLNDAKFKMPATGNAIEP